MSNNYTKINDLRVSNKLLDFINNELFLDTNINVKKFWKDFDKVAHELSIKNKKLMTGITKIKMKIFL